MKAMKVRIKKFQLALLSGILVGLVVSANAAERETDARGTKYSATVLGEVGGEPYYSLMRNGWPNDLYGNEMSGILKTKEKKTLF